MPRGVYNRKRRGRPPAAKKDDKTKQTMYFVMEDSRYNQDSATVYTTEDDLIEWLEGEGFSPSSKTVIYKVTASKKMIYKRPALAGLLVEV